MMKRNNHDIFFHLYPSIDIHGEEAATADLIIKEFIQDNYYLGKEKIAIIHGKGSGVLKEKTHDIAKKSPYVASFYLEYPNTGCTVITLKENVKKQ